MGYSDLIRGKLADIQGDSNTMPVWLFELLEGAKELDSEFERRSIDFETLQNENTVLREKLDNALKENAELLSKVTKDPEPDPEPDEDEIIDVDEIEKIEM